MLCVPLVHAARKLKKRSYTQQGSNTKQILTQDPPPIEGPVAHRLRDTMLPGNPWIKPGGKLESAA